MRESSASALRSIAPRSAPGALPTTFEHLALVASVVAIAIDWSDSNSRDARVLANREVDVLIPIVEGVRNLLIGWWPACRALRSLAGERPMISVALSASDAVASDVRGGSASCCARSLGDEAWRSSSDISSMLGWSPGSLPIGMELIREQLFQLLATLPTARLIAVIAVVERRTDLSCSSSAYREGARPLPVSVCSISAAFSCKRSPLLPTWRAVSASGNFGAGTGQRSRKSLRLGCSGPRNAGAGIVSDIGDQLTRRPGFRRLRRRSAKACFRSRRRGRYGLGDAHGAGK